MPGRAPIVSVPAWNPPETGGFSVEARVITPMFGGGFEPRFIDEECPVRAASIRGHLRFWWRATAKARYWSPADLFASEEALWGSAKVYGKVKLDVAVTNVGTKIGCSELAGNTSAKRGPGLGYLLFTFQRDGGQPEAVGRQDVRFTLGIDCPGDRRSEVERAVRAWMTFGGIGARTRRGCGALAAGDAAWLPASVDSLQTWIGGPAAGLPVGPEVPTLHGASIAVGDECRNARQAWEKLAHFWARFRKGHFGELEYTPMAGSRWKDYKTLERAQRSSEPAIRLAKPHLGLPIIYQATGGAKYAPTLTAEQSDRMASPLLLSPVAFADNSFRPIVVVLNAKSPATIRVDETLKRLLIDPDDPVLIALGSETPLEAVIAAAKQEWPQGRTYGPEAGP